MPVKTESSSKIPAFPQSTENDITILISIKEKRAKFDGVEDR